MEGSTGSQLASRARAWLTADRGHRLSVVAALAASAIVFGALLALLTPIGGIAVLVAAVGGVLMLRDVRWSLLALIAVVCLLPFASLPFT